MLSLYPNVYFDKIEKITIEFLQKNKIKALILDMDNTLINYKKEMPENIELPKKKLEKNYESNVIPDIYKELIERNSVKLNQNAKNIEKIALVENYTVASKVKEMFKILVKQKRFVFNKIFSINKRNKQEVVTAFSGLLELSRRNKVETSQEKLFGDITVEKVKKIK